MVSKIEVIEAATPEPMQFFPTSNSQQPTPIVPVGTIEREYEKPPMKVSWLPEDVPVTKENLLKALGKPVLFLCVWQAKKTT